MAHFFRQGENVSTAKTHFQLHNIFERYEILNSEKSCDRCKTDNVVQSFRQGENVSSPKIYNNILKKLQILIKWLKLNDSLRDEEAYREAKCLLKSLEEEPERWKNTFTWCVNEREYRFYTGHKRAPYQTEPQGKTYSTKH